MKEKVVLSLYPDFAETIAINGATAISRNKSFK